MTRTEEGEIPRSEDPKDEFIDVAVCPWCGDPACLEFGICKATGRSPYFVPGGEN